MVLSNPRLIKGWIYPKLLYLSTLKINHSPTDCFAAIELNEKITFHITSSFGFAHAKRGSQVRPGGRRGLGKDQGDLYLQFYQIHRVASGIQGWQFCDWSLRHQYSTPE